MRQENKSMKDTYEEDIEILLQDIEKKIAKRIVEIEKYISRRDIKKACLTAKTRAMRDLHHILSLRQGKPTEISRDLSVEVVLSEEEEGVSDDKT